MSAGTTTMTGYTVEVRTSYHSPCQIGGVIVDAEWRSVPHETRADNSGIPHGYFDRKLTEYGLLGHTVAEAIRWWFLSVAEAERATGALCLETRLKKHKVVIRHEVTEDGVISALDCRGNPVKDAIEQAKD